MSSRLEKWVTELIEDGLSEYEIAYGIDNGDINIPEWLSSSPCTNIGYAIWDNEESDGRCRLYNLDILQENE